MLFLHGNDFNCNFFSYECSSTWRNQLGILPGHLLRTRYQRTVWKHPKSSTSPRSGTRWPICFSKTTSTTTASTESETFALSAQRRRSKLGMGLYHVHISKRKNSLIIQLSGGDDNNQKLSLFQHPDLVKCEQCDMQRVSSESSVCVIHVNISVCLSLGFYWLFEISNLE